MSLKASSVALAAISCISFWGSEGSIVIGSPRSAAEPPQAVIGYNIAQPATTSCASCSNPRFAENFQCPKGGYARPFGSGLPSNFTLPTDQMTVEAWVKFDRKSFESGRQGILSCYASDTLGPITPYGQYGFQFGMHKNLMSFGLSTSDPFFFADDGSEASRQYASSYEALLQAALVGPQYWREGRWYHVAGTYDGTARRLFIDGELWGVMKQQGYIVYTDCEFALGASASCALSSHSPYSADLPLDSPYEVAEVRLWSVARTQQQIVQHKDEEIDTATQGLLGVWRDVSQDPVSGDTIVVDETGTQPPARVPHGGISAPAAPQPVPPAQTEPQWDESPDGNCMSFDDPVAKARYPNLLGLCAGFLADKAGFVVTLDEFSTFKRDEVENQLTAFVALVGYLPTACQTALQQTMCTR